MAEMAELCELFQGAPLSPRPTSATILLVPIFAATTDLLIFRPTLFWQPGLGLGLGLGLEDEAEELDDWEDDYDYPEEEPLSGAGYRVSAALEEANKMFLRTSRAREAALDGGFQMHYEKTPFDQLAFIEELFSLMVVNRLTEELGCDEMIDRE
ncbi:EP300-interacting inhibitor of differentiation 1 [Fukomys damarensis]|uniref:EP300-interacting inhibitor of differentiation 1 n=1 Tax=Fukomys damarensis TaxID=885580 RepID=UPI00145514B2|nr:EP300-interacting inhibitor of differentiation 1 [Fukomys damarensis]